MADIAKLIYKKNTLYGWESGDIKSSNDTYDDIVFLTQAEYDALPSKNPNTLYSTPEGWPAGFDPSNTKTFYLSSTSDLANAQEAYDWYVAWNNPIIRYMPESSALAGSSWLYFFSNYYNGNDLDFTSYDLFDDSASYGWGRSVYRRRLSIIADSSNVVTEIQRYVQVPVLSYLSKSASNGTYTPSNDYDPATKKYVDDRTGWLSVDHLEEKGLVWELYTMNDTMFRQLTPKLSECTVEGCKVWDTASNTEIHIQRIASWTASNKLKLKVKKVWSPTTTLKVEVRGWIQVTVTADSEAYWYWDSSDILATWSIAYSAITTDWQELEVTLNNAVWWNKGDLLSIVCYQEASWSAMVDANNYYVLACDGTQWSEAFNFISVNGNTRTRSFLMPYCIGDWFEQSLLVKIWWTISVQQTLLDEPAEKANTDWTTPDTWAWRTYTYWFTIEAKNAWQYTVSFESKQAAWSSTSISRASEAYYILVDDEVIEHLTFTESSWTSHSYTLTLDKPWTITYKCVWRVNVNNNPYNIWYYTRNLKVISYNLSKNTTQKKELPREEKTIWEEMTATLFGRHIDWTFIN